MDAQDGMSAEAGMPFLHAARKPGGAVMGHDRAGTETGLGVVRTVLSCGMPEAKKAAMHFGVACGQDLENTCSIKELRVYPLFSG